MIKEQGTNTMTRRGISTFVAAIVLCACSGSQIDVGPAGGGAPASDAGGSPATGGASPSVDDTCTLQTALPDWPSASACASATDLPVVGTWHGYVENQAAPWDEITLDIKGANSSGLCGTLTVGNAAPPAPATDAIHTYPPGATMVGSSNIIPGFASTLLNGSASDTRVRFSIADTEGYQSWCALQTPYARGGGVCGCTPVGPGMGDIMADQCQITSMVSGITRLFTCQQLDMCGGSIGHRGAGVCACNATACAAANRANISFDLTLSGDMLEGSDTAHAGTRMHFARKP